MPAFHDTVRGARFFDVTLPRLVDEMANLANAVSALVVLLREHAAAETTAGAATPTARERT